MKITRNNKYKRRKRAIITTEIMIFLILGSIVVLKKKDIVDDKVLASANNIGYVQYNNDYSVLYEETENIINVAPINSSISKTVPTIVPAPTKKPTNSPTPTIAPTPTPIAVPKALLYPTPGPDYNPKEQTDKLVALTFDDGPSKNYTLKILEILKDNNCTATFFVLGTNAKAYPDIVEEVYDSGMEIANHSNNHENFKKLSNKEGLNNLKKVNNILKNITEEQPVLFRPPGGNYNNLVRSYITHPIIYWAKDSKDWSTAYTDKEIINNIMDGLNEGDIILCHDIVKRTHTMLEEIIKLIQDKGYKIVSVSEMYDYYDIKLEDGQVYAGVKVKKNK